MHSLQHSWVRRIYPHNPLYLVSAWVVLHGVSVAFRGDLSLRLNELMTPLLCGYILMLVCAGWLVVRVGKVWEDARTILLAVLLMFTALSTSYDDLCLRIPEEGTRQLALAFGFSLFVVEVILASLRICLPLGYRLPFYVQLAVLFAFPAYLGHQSVAGNDPAMCLGVLAFPVAAGASLLLLWPAVVRRTLQRGPNGTPWLWPYYPWSIFVFVAIAFSIRGWMLSVSFSPAVGVSPAFAPFFLTPILVAASILLAELGVVHRNLRVQRVAMLLLGGQLGLGFLFTEATAAQELSLELLRSNFAAPPLVIGVSVLGAACVAILRKVSWAEPVAIVAALLVACVDSQTTTLAELNAPRPEMLAAVGVWLLTRGAWSLDWPRLALAYAPLAAEYYLRPGSLLLEGVEWHSVAGWGLVWVAVLPLVCRDLYSLWLRVYAPLLFGLAAGLLVIWLLLNTTAPPSWVVPATLGILVPLVFAYWIATRLRWHLLSSLWITLTAVIASTAVLLRSVGDAQLQTGLAWYAGGCGMLLVALAVSFCKAGLLGSLYRWLMQLTPARTD